jgi:hypothetical protein
MTRSTVPLLIFFYYYCCFCVVIFCSFVGGFSSPSFPRGAKCTTNYLFHPSISATSTTSSNNGVCLAAFPNNGNNAILKGKASTATAASSQLSAVPKFSNNGDSHTKTPDIVTWKKKTQQQGKRPATTGSGSTSSPSSWDTFKDGIYDFVDFLRGGTDAVFLASSSSTRSTSRETRKKPQMALTYRETVEQATVGNLPKGAKTLSTPNIPVMEKYKASLKTTMDTSTRGYSNERRSIGSSNSSSSSSNDGENRYPSKFRQTFDSTKDLLYGIVDSLTVTSSNKGKKGNNNGDNDEDEGVTNTLEESKVACKTSVNKDKDVIAVSKYAPDLSSLNPAKRIQANLKIATTQKQQEKEKRRNQQSESMMESAKKVVFGFVDFIQTAQTNLRNLPSELEKNIEMTQGKIGQTVDEIKITPKKIQQQVEDTKKSLRETQRKAIQLVNDVQQVPKKVGDTVVGTVREVQALPTKVQSSIEETRNSVEVAREEVQSLFMETKYLTGLEKRPIPPPPPPRPKTSSEKAKELAVKVTKGTVLFAGKAAVVVVKGTVGMVAGGVKLAWQGVKNRRKKQLEVVVENKRERSTLSKYTSTGAPQSDNTPKSIAEIDPMLEKEVAEALRLAEAAVSMQERKERSEPNTKIDPNSNVMSKPVSGVASPNDIDINEAMQRAKAAAEEAKRNAEELEEMLNRRSVVKK